LKGNDPKSPYKNYYERKLAEEQQFKKDVFMGAVG